MFKRIISILSVLIVIMSIVFLSCFNVNSLSYLDEVDALRAKYKLQEIKDYTIDKAYDLLLEFKVDYSMLFEDEIDETFVHFNVDENFNIADYKYSVFYFLNPGQSYDNTLRPAVMFFKDEPVFSFNEKGDVITLSSNLNEGLVFYYSSGTMYHNFRDRGYHWTTFSGLSSIPKERVFFAYEPTGTEILKDFDFDLSKQINLGNKTYLAFDCNYWIAIRKDNIFGGDEFELIAFEHVPVLRVNGENQLEIVNLYGYYAYCQKIDIENEEEKENLVFAQKYTVNEAELVRKLDSGVYTITLSWADYYNKDVLNFKTVVKGGNDEYNKLIQKYLGYKGTADEIYSKFDGEYIDVNEVHDKLGKGYRYDYALTYYYGKRPYAIQYFGTKPKVTIITKSNNDKVYIFYPSNVRIGEGLIPSKIFAPTYIYYPQQANTELKYKVFNSVACMNQKFTYAGETFDGFAYDIDNVNTRITTNWKISSKDYTSYKENINPDTGEKTLDDDADYNIGDDISQDDDKYTSWTDKDGNVHADKDSNVDYSIDAGDVKIDSSSFSGVISSISNFFKSMYSILPQQLVAVLGFGLALIAVVGIIRLVMG